MNKPQAPQQPDFSALFNQLTQQAQADQIHATQALASGDQASLLARYGARLALAGTGGTTAASTGLMMPGTRAT